MRSPPDTAVAGRDAMKRRTCGAAGVGGAGEGSLGAAARGARRRWIGGQGRVHQELERPRRGSEVGRWGTARGGWVGGCRGGFIAPPSPPSLLPSTGVGEAKERGKGTEQGPP